VLQLAQRHGFHIVEDDTYSHIAPEHATRLALDGLQRTIYVSGFAKILAPSWRTSPHRRAVRAAARHQAAVHIDHPLGGAAGASCAATPSASACAWPRRERSVRLALQAGCRFVAEPAGLFGWVDTGVDTDALAQRMLDEGYLLAPGALFHASRQPSTLMRINFSTTQDAAFWPCSNACATRCLRHETCAGAARGRPAALRRECPFVYLPGSAAGCG
jgi:aspartate/methionine/tyrosine aminotransferase